MSMNSVATVTPRARKRIEHDFLTTLRDSGNITVSCMKAGISRALAYKWRDNDARFRDLWFIAIEISVDKLEYVARNRAVKGTKKPIYYKGELIDHVYEPSDRLMELLLKAKRPEEFNPVQKLEHSGGVSIDVVQFGTNNSAPMTIEHEEQGAISSTDEAIESTDPSSSIGGALSKTPPPKSRGAQNDEAPHIASFSDSDVE